MRRPLLQGVLFATLAAAGACGSDNLPPVAPTPPILAVTETFTGTLTVNGAVTFPFTVSQAGSANATLKALQPQLTLRTQSGGAGTYVVGETIYVGDSLDTATGTATVYAWIPGSNALLLDGLTGTLPIDAVLVGATSGARWANQEVTTTSVGIALGTWSGTTCSVVLANDLSGIGGQVTGVVQQSGSLCARVYDVGRMLAPSTFILEVSHF
jgi:hypothetical protein